MNSRSASLLFTLVLAFALAVRIAPGRDLRLAEDERDLGASRWLVDDPATAQHLRRIELTLAEGLAPERDSFLAHPAGGEIGALPVFDALLAGTAQRVLATPRGDPSLGGVSEADLEHFVLQAGPAIGALAVALGAWTAWIIARGRIQAAIVAALVLALAPSAVHVGSLGHLDALVVVLALYALLARSTVQTLRATEPLPAVLEALLAGVLAGLLASVSAIGAWIAVPTGVALACQAWRAEPARSAIASRAGLFFALVAAFVARMPLAEGPWEIDAAGVVARWAAGSADLLLVLAAPFALRLLIPRGDGDVPRTGRSWFTLAGVLAVLVLLAWEAPRAVRALEPGLSAWWASRDLRASVDSAAAPLFAGDWLTALFEPSLVALAALPAAAWLLLRRRDPETMFLVAGVAVGAIAMVVQRSFGTLFVSAAAWALAAAVRELADRDGERKVTRFAVLAAVALVPHVVVTWFDRVDPAAREERIAFVAGLRWMRTGTESSAPFNSSTAHWTGGVIADPRAGGLVEYHARRPVLGSAAAWLADPDGARATAALLGGHDMQGFVEWSRERSVRWIVAAPRYLRDAPTNAATNRVAAQLALGQPAVAGLSPIYAAQRIVGIDGRAPRTGEPSGPVVRVYEIISSAPEDAGPVMRAR